MQLRHTVNRAALVGTLALTTCAIGIGATTASAAAPSDVEIQGTSAQVKTTRGSALFYDIGDDLQARDIKKDGYDIRAYLTYNGRMSSATTRFGDGDKATTDLNIPEGTTVLLQLCYVKAGADVKCSVRHKGKA